MVFVQAKKGIWKGKRMPGHMGMDWNTLKGLKVNQRLAGWGISALSAALGAVLSAKIG